MRIFLVAYFVELPQDLVPYAQRVVRVMGAAALDIPHFPLSAVDALIVNIRSPACRGHLLT